MINPRTKVQWQEAVDAANGALALLAARIYGLVSGGPEINEDRCLEILKKGKRRGVFPRQNSIENFVRSLLERGTCNRHGSRTRTRV